MTSSKKTIALNTLYLYCSSFFQLLVGLYTSRLLLEALGVEDFGLYGVVGGIITLLSFINMAMGSASSRYLTFELARGTIETQRRIFSVVFYVHAIIAAITFILGESVGLWYVTNKLVVPEGRMYAAHWVYQAAILMSMANIIQVPYNASVTAHEKMGFLSLWSSANVFLKMAVILFLYIITADRLILYAVLMLLATCFITAGFVVYCRIHFNECVFVSVKNKALFKEVLSFAGFNAFSSFANAVRTQGTGLLINRFFGVALNAAGSVASMVSGYIISFTANIITAFRPQIVKCYAIEDYQQMAANIQMCMTCCLGMFTLIAVPIFLEMDYVLALWLGIVPPYSAVFCRISLIGSTFGLLNMTVLIAVQATSRVRDNSLYISVASLMSIAILYLCFTVTKKPYIAYIIYAITELCILSISTWNTKRLIPQIRFKPILWGLLKLSIIVMLSALGTLLLKQHMKSSILRLIFVTIVYCVFFGISSFYLVLPVVTRNHVITYLKSRL